MRADDVPASIPNERDAPPHATRRPIGSERGPFLWLEDDDADPGALERRLTQLELDLRTRVGEESAAGASSEALARAYAQGIQAATADAPPTLASELTQLALLWAMLHHERNAEPGGRR